MAFAGSAIKQNVGDLSYWDDWKPSTLKHGWLLIAGATNPPKNITTSQRRSKDVKSGNFLEGTKYDMQVMEEFVSNENLGFLHNTLRMLDMETHEVRKRIKKFFKWCKENRYKPVLYYTGHGEVGSGDWCFNDDTISVCEIEELLPSGTKYPLIISDCCYSGHWANYCLERNEEDDINFHCLSACPEYSTAEDNPRGGGALTMWMTGKLEDHELSTEPLYSGGTRDDYDFDVKVVIKDFISGHVKKTDYFLLSQHLIDDKYNAIFAESFFLNYPLSAWGEFSSFREMMTYIKDSLWHKKKVYSITANDNKFVVFGMEGYGTKQAIICEDKVEDYWDKDGVNIWIESL